MSKKSQHPITIVTKFEVIRQLKKPSFWIALLFTPVLISGLILLNAVNSKNIQDSTLSTRIESIKAIGIVDHPGIFQGKLNTKALQPETTSKDPSNSEPTPPFETKYFESESDGLAALKDQQIQTLYLIPTDFDKNPTIKSFSIASTNNIFSISQANLIKSLISSAVTKYLSPIHLSLINGSYQIENINLDQETGQPVNLLGSALVPIAVVVIFYFMLTVFGSRLPMIVVEEKENRISEMILTSVSAKHLIIGKITSAIMLGLIQISCFIAPIIAGAIIYRDHPFIHSLLSSVQIDPFIIIVNVLLLLIAYFFFASVSILAGTLTSTAREASQYSGITALGIIGPLFFLNILMETNYRSSFVVNFLTYFPLSSPLSLMLRNAFKTINLPELALGISILFIYSALVVKLAIYSFQKHALTFSLIKPSLKPRKLWKSSKN